MLLVVEGGRDKKLLLENTKRKSLEKIKIKGNRNINLIRLYSLGSMVSNLNIFRKLKWNSMLMLCYI